MSEDVQVSSREFVRLFLSVDVSEAGKGRESMEVKEVLEQVRDGSMSVNDAEAYFRRQPLEELGYAKLDTHRKLRSGFAEVVFCSGKADEHLVQIYERIYAAEGEVLGTRASKEQAALIQDRFSEAEYEIGRASCRERV